MALLKHTSGMQVLRSKSFEFGVDIAFGCRHSLRSFVSSCTSQANYHAMIPAYAVCPRGILGS